MTLRRSSLWHSILIVALVALAWGVGVADDASTVARMDAVLAAAYPADGPGAAVIVVKDGQVVYRKARGMASLELGVLLAPEMVFRLGSITKQFTAVATLMLVHDGRLSLQDPVERHLPDYPNGGHTITVEHLLTHSSGIQSYTDMPGWMATRILADLSLQALIDGFKNEPMQFPPGERFRYNNSAYVLLGAIIERASGQSYEQFLRTRIFEPLGMTHTHFGSNEPIIPKRVQGYTRAGEETQNARYLSMTQPHAAGSLVSSVDDLARWDAALYGDDLLPRALLERAWTPYVVREGPPTRYGYGWAIGSIRGRRVIDHGGGIPGFSTYAVRLPEERVFVAVLANSDNPTGNPVTVGRTLAALAVGDPFPEPTATIVDPEVLRGYAAVYEIDRDVRRTVVSEDGRLFLVRGGGRRQEARPRSRTEFFLDGSLTVLHFVTDRTGRATEMLIFGEGSDEPERARRVE